MASKNWWNSPSLLWACYVAVAFLTHQEVCIPSLLDKIYHTYIYIYIYIFTYVIYVLLTITHVQNIESVVAGQAPKTGTVQ